LIFMFFVDSPPNLVGPSRPRIKDLHRDPLRRWPLCTLSGPSFNSLTRTCRPLERRRRVVSSTVYYSSLLTPAEYIVCVQFRPDSVASTASSTTSYGHDHLLATPPTVERNFLSKFQINKNSGPVHELWHTIWRLTRMWSYSRGF